MTSPDLWAPLRGARPGRVIPVCAGGMATVYLAEDLKHDRKGDLCPLGGRRMF